MTEVVTKTKTKTKTNTDTNTKTNTDTKTKTKTDTNTKTAITGGIGSGKSFVCNLLRERGVEIYDCDKAAKRLMRESAEIREQLTAAIGADAYTDNGPNKAVISRFLLQSKENNAIVNAIVHPAVARDFQASGLRWMECAILFESGFNRLVDTVVCVVAPQETRLQRVMLRDNISRKQALEWIAKQMPQEEIVSRSHFCIINDGYHDLQPQIAKILNNQ